MKIKAVIFNHNQCASAQLLYMQLRDHVDTSLFDSGSDPHEIPEATTHRMANLYWTGLWNKAWELFSDYDVIWGLGGDCTLLDQPDKYVNAINSAFPFGLWSPVIAGSSLPFMQSQSKEGHVFSVRHMEGIAFAISSPLWELVGPLDQANYIGYGLDIYCAYISRKHNLKNILDGRVSLQHPRSASYDDELAKRLMHESLKLKLGSDWCDAVDWWWGRTTTFKANAISRIVLSGTGKSYVRPFLAR